jgi:hypothetical protein
MRDDVQCVCRHTGIAQRGIRNALRITGGHCGCVHESCSRGNGHPRSCTPACQSRATIYRVQNCHAPVAASTSPRTGKRDSKRRWRQKQQQETMVLSPGIRAIPERKRPGDGRQRMSTHVKETKCEDACTQQLSCLLAVLLLSIEHWFPSIFFAPNHERTSSLRSRCRTTSHRARQTGRREGASSRACAGRYVSHADGKGLRRPALCQCRCRPCSLLLLLRQLPPPLRRAR